MADSSTPPWHAHLNIDVIVHILNRSIFHPFIAWLIPLCLRAITTPYHAPEFVLACTWATAVTLFTILSAVNNRIAYGLPRDVDWNEEVVVITGGASGLGKVIAEMYGMRGASVAVLDLAEPREEESEALASVKFYRCDVADSQAVEKAKEQVEQDLGPPTILINNAAAPIAGKPLLSLSSEEIHKTLAVNLQSHFHTIRTFLPSLLSSETGGTIVTISSVLGKLGASNLTDYAASKAGLIALHNSLRAELRSSDAPEGSENVRMILVTPGQLGTGLFHGLKTPSQFFGPVVEAVELAREIVTMIDSGMSGEISLPFYARWIEWVFVLPAGVQRVVRWMSGVDRAMEGFRRPRENVRAVIEKKSIQGEE